MARSRYEQAIREYLEQMRAGEPEAVKSERFATLLARLFEKEPEPLRDYLSGRERPVRVREGARVRRGHIDSLCGNLVIEFERSLAGCGRPGAGARGRLKEAQEQLWAYISALWSEEEPGERLPYLAMATDGRLFALYTPVAREPAAEGLEPDDISLEPVTRELVDLAAMSPEEAYVWLDR